jgi:hypothetical protein
MNNKKSMRLAAQDELSIHNRSKMTRREKIGMNNEISPVPK